VCVAEDPGMQMSRQHDVMFSDCGRKPENPERTHASTGRTCKLHAERPPGRELNPSCCK
ncbi:hypothetical protein AMECASPLE_011234, partial [Ameca splendens]